MKQVDVLHAQAAFSQLLAEVEAGEEVVIARDGKPVARLMPAFQRPRVLRQPGAMKGEFVWDEESWAAGDADILEMFEESINRPLSS